ncbi:MAG TPA: toll/interleukin-1 receptor domain-containing protein, partial [Pyrinomonadaceae bacterium]|nr:toll/interleukin-1 receptor domain-containing protein [Pyrinomonadaceae bacterium]
DDLELARDLERRLKEAGVRVYSAEKSSTPGDNILSKFKKQLHEADEVIVILTGKSVDSPSILSEIGAAHGLNKRVTPVLVNVEPKELPPFIGKNFVKFAELPGYIAAVKERAGA